MAQISIERTITRQAYRIYYTLLLLIYIVREYKFNKLQRQNWNLILNYYWIDMEKSSKFCVCVFLSESVRYPTLSLSLSLSVSWRKIQFEKIAWTNNDSNWWIHDLNCIKNALADIEIDWAENKRIAIRTHTQTHICKATV